MPKRLFDVYYQNSSIKITHRESEMHNKLVFGLQAITMINGKTLEKRTIAIDWAVERNVYEMNANVDKKSGSF